ncbi:glycine C-acetyltransferase [Azohydromonas lata]|uniref:2-amino-3-ketobutyrate coenzyme A ligase n=1 Tax=Azohydromonas lata TaxID=45677 RepID=A0ABU5IDE2_9BURK|nr:glycine C-acetyltransferase [Azohydromonas lata]MDZ5456675.1 glycine C-acetyltransferase [Azohydromonas lata]
MNASEEFNAFIARELQGLQSAGLFKQERVIAGAQGPRVRLADGREVLNFCANNYLGLSAHPAVVRAAQQAMDTHGYGMSSVRFICGTQDQHKTLEARLSRFLGMEDTILYAAAFDANGGLFEPLFTQEDAIVSDALNHASVIDGIRLCKARRYRYAHDDMADLERCLRQAREDGARFVLAFTDGVFSMDGSVAQLHRMRELCDAHGALLGVDDSHATGFVGPSGRGTHELRGLLVDGVARVDLITGTLGKALGGASGGFTSGRREVVELLRQRSRPYLFSNSLAPAIVGASLAVLELLEQGGGPREKLMDNARWFREAMARCRFDLKPGSHPIVPIMVYDAPKAQALAARMLELGVYVVGFFHPVVPQGQARIRVQLSAAHERADLEQAVAAFRQAGRELGLVA